MAQQTIGGLALSACLLALGGCDGSLPIGQAGRLDTRARRFTAQRESVCPSQRGAGWRYQPAGSTAVRTPAATDSDCAAGKERPLLSPNGPAVFGVQPDLLFLRPVRERLGLPDACPLRLPRLGRATRTANLCVTGGNCAVDADCGGERLLLPRRARRLLLHADLLLPHGRRHLHRRHRLRPGRIRGTCGRATTTRRAATSPAAAPAWRRRSSCPAG